MRLSLLIEQLVFDLEEAIQQSLDFSAKPAPEPTVDKAKIAKDIDDSIASRRAAEDAKEKRRAAGKKGSRYQGEAASKARADRRHETHAKKLVQTGHSLTTDGIQEYMSRHLPRRYFGGDSDVLGRVQGGIRAALERLGHKVTD